MSNPLEVVMVEAAEMYAKYRRELNDLLEKIAAVAGEIGCRAVLFGSTARGDNVYASDIDVLVICRDISLSARERAEIQAYIEEKIGLEPPHPVHIVIATPEEAETILGRRIW